MRNLPRYTLPPSLVHMYDMQAFLTPFLGDNAPTRRKTGKLGLLALNPPAAVSTSDRLAVQPAYAPDGTGRPAVGTGFSRWRFDGTDPGLRNSLKTCRCSQGFEGLVTMASNTSDQEKAARTTLGSLCSQSVAPFARRLSVP
jgi:hypothetical protein